MLALNSHVTLRIDVKSELMKIYVESSPRILLRTCNQKEL